MRQLRFKVAMDVDGMGHLKNVAQSLRGLADKLDARQGLTGNLEDASGNKVGVYGYSDEGVDDIGNVHFSRARES